MAAERFERHDAMVEYHALVDQCFDNLRQTCKYDQYVNSENKAVLALMEPTSEQTVAKALLPLKLWRQRHEKSVKLNRPFDLPGVVLADTVTILENTRVNGLKRTLLSMAAVKYGIDPRRLSDSYVLEMVDKLTDRKDKDAMTLLKLLRKDPLLVISDSRPRQQVRAVCRLGDQDRVELAICNGVIVYNPQGAVRLIQPYLQRKRREVEKGEPVPFLEGAYFFPTVR